MSLASDERQEGDLPRLVGTWGLEPLQRWRPYDVKFYPYVKDDADPVFAVVGIQHIIICRPSSNKDNPVQIIQTIEDGDNDASNFSVAWTLDLETGAPLLCVAGGNTKIKIINSITGKLLASLTGHGGDVNDLAISPVNPRILASASADTTIRLWILGPANMNQPCAVLLAGEGHRDTILSIAFHETGRYILSGGQDHIVNLWTLPELLDNNAGTKKLTMIHYPHFSTSEVHGNMVDCVAFHGDLILSKAFGEDCIVLWLIKGFNSTSSPPPTSSAPMNHDNQHGTRSAFSPPSSTSAGSAQYMRLLQFAIPGCFEFYMRFSLYSPLSTQAGHPILALCNSRSKVFFWDLFRLEEYHTYMESVQELDQNGDLLPPKRPLWLNKSLDVRLMREASLAGSATSSPHTLSTETLTGNRVEVAASLERKYTMKNPLGMIEAHRTDIVPIPKIHITGRQVAWSASGKWCVVVGAPNVIAVFQRRGDGKGRA